MITDSDPQASIGTMDFGRRPVDTVVNVDPAWVPAMANVVWHVGERAMHEFLASFVAGSYGGTWWNHGDLPR